MTTIRFDDVSKVFRQRHADAPETDLWALRNVSFECAEGDVVGLVGRNGCGKSTLLKLAAGITAPTRGSVFCEQPIAPMLELGAGFHPDLTGRDNIALNCALLGLGRPIAPALFDQIVAFAELEEHIDTPVKHYSSGMYARLGFAIAVHSRARVLLVDEVLSVGDQLFRRKCLARMRHLREQGTTILLVSHDAASIRAFCTRALAIDQGRVIANGRPEEALRVYEWSLRGIAGERAAGVTISRVVAFDEDGTPLDALHGTRLRVSIEYDATAAPEGWVFAVRVRREDGICCAACLSVAHGRSHGTATVELDDLNLTVGQYAIEVYIEDAISFAPLAMEFSLPFRVEGEFEQKRGYDGVIKTRHRWRFY